LWLPIRLVSQTIGGPELPLDVADDVRAADERKGPEVPDTSDESEELGLRTKKRINARVDRIVEFTHSRIRSELLSGGESDSATWLLSSSHKTSGRWLSNNGCVLYGKFGLEPPDFAEALRLRLLLPPARLLGWSCQCRVGEIV
jgi:hypothetical protein